MVVETFYDSADAAEYGIETDQLQRVIPNYGSEPDTASTSSPPPQPPTDTEGRQVDPGTVVLIEGLGPNNPELHYPHSIEPLAPHSYNDRDTEMTDHNEVAKATESLDISDIVELPENANKLPVEHESVQSPYHKGDDFDSSDLRKTATAGLEAVSQAQDENDGHVPESRHDSAQDLEPQLSKGKLSPRSGWNSPLLKLQTDRVMPKAEDTLATSPTLSKHVITMAAGGIEETLPALQPNSPIKEGSAASPLNEKLPPIRQLVPAQLGPLGELADAALQHDPRHGRQHSHSFGSSTAQSPGLPYYHYPSNGQGSPSSQHPYSAMSPNSNFSDPYGSPKYGQNPAAYYADRRPSVPIDHVPPPPPSLPSASSSGESMGTSGSSVDGYSTTHTTPIDMPDSTPRPLLPPPLGITPSPAVITTGFKCDWQGCTAPPFQTQYLLSSHKNVHSQNRPHYCPLKTCPRSEGGKGFKRKNEMMRHGLVHDSPGYACPFCPDKEHRYPRPDNLQRHVRVHHVDKDRDDPQLREVLAKRNGIAKTRRRRTNTTGSAGS